MKNLFFMIMSSFLPITLLNLFAESNSSFAQPQQGQPQMGQPQMGVAAGQGLEAYSLPSGPISENDMPGIKTVIEQVLNKISEPVRTAGRKSDNQTIKSSILTFQDWLKR